MTASEQPPGECAWISPVPTGTPRAISTFSDGSSRRQRLHKCSCNFVSGAPFSIFGQLVISVTGFCFASIAYKTDGSLSTQRRAARCSSNRASSCGSKRLLVRVVFGLILGGLAGLRGTLIRPDSYVVGRCFGRSRLQ